MDYYVRITTYVDEECKSCFVYVGIGIFSSLLVSLCWWENTMQATHKMQVWCFTVAKLQLDIKLLHASTCTHQNKLWCSTGLSTWTHLCLIYKSFHCRIFVFIVSVKLLLSYCVMMTWYNHFYLFIVFQQDTLSELEGFRDFVFVISSILRILVIGIYQPSISVLLQ